MFSNFVMCIDYFCDLKNPQNLLKDSAQALPSL